MLDNQINSQTNNVLEEINHNLLAFKELAARVFHGRGHFFAGFEHLNIEWYPPYLFVQNFKEQLDSQIAAILESIFNRHTFIEAIFVQTRTWPELSTSIFTQRSPCELPIVKWAALTPELSCQITLGKNRNTGVFLDMRAGWHWAQANAQNKKVLNLFSYTSIFSLFALQGGANNVVNMDMAAGVLKTAQRNHQQNGLSDGKAAFYKRDILKSAQQFSRMGPYDLIIIDPPPYQKKSFTGWKDYRKLLVRCESSLAPQGKILACLNNPQVSQQEFIDSLKETLPKANRFEHIETSNEIKEAEEDKGLKLIAVHF
jgi:23S rRNA (cytosine1962-C5)-methyltransferase